VMGLSFKENCPDLRNTRVVDIVKELRGYEAQVDVYDPWADPADARKSCGIDLIEAPQKGDYDGIIIAVAHSQFRDLGVEGVRALGKPEHVLYDLKYVFAAEAADLRL